MLVDDLGTFDLSSRRSRRPSGDVRADSAVRPARQRGPGSVGRAGTGRRGRLVLSVIVLLAAASAVATVLSTPTAAATAAADRAEFATALARTLHTPFRFYGTVTGPDRPSVGLSGIADFARASGDVVAGLDETRVVDGVVYRTLSDADLPVRAFLPHRISWVRGLPVTSGLDVFGGAAGPLLHILAGDDGGDLVRDGNRFTVSWPASDPLPGYFPDALPGVPRLTPKRAPPARDTATFVVGPDGFIESVTETTHLLIDTSSERGQAPTETTVVTLTLDGPGDPVIVAAPPAPFTIDRAGYIAAFTRAFGPAG